MRILFILLLIPVLSVSLSCGQETDNEMEQTEEVEMTANQAIDPVCDMKVNKDTAQYVADYEGEKYYFCMEEHKVAFLENPEMYLTETQ